MRTGSAQATLTFSCFCRALTSYTRSALVILTKSTSRYSNEGRFCTTPLQVILIQARRHAWQPGASLITPQKGHRICVDLGHKATSHGLPAACLPSPDPPPRRRAYACVPYRTCARVRTSDNRRAGSEVRPARAASSSGACSVFSLTGHKDKMSKKRCTHSEEAYVPIVNIHPMYPSWVIALCTWRWRGAGVALAWRAVCAVRAACEPGFSYPNFFSPRVRGPCALGGPDRGGSAT